jgi:hypothetical protein
VATSAQLGHEVLVATQQQLRLDPVVHRGQPALLQPGGLAVLQRLGVDVGQRRPPPEGKRRPEQARGMFDVAGRSRLPALGHQALEGQQVELVGAGPDQVPGRLRDGHRVAGAGGGDVVEPSEPHDVVLQGDLGLRRRLPAPEQLDQPAGRHRLVGVQRSPASRARCLAALTATSRSPSRTSSGPRMRNSTPTAVSP